MNGFQRRKEAKKENILQAAYELFSENDMKKVTISKIAESACVSPVTIYNYFGSKNNLLQNVVQKFMERQWLEYCDLIRKNIPFPDLIEEMIFKKSETSYMIYEDFIQSCIRKDQRIKELVDEFYNSKTLPLLMELIERGRKEGYINETISTEALLFYIDIHREAFNRPELYSHQTHIMRLDLIMLFFYGVHGKPVIYSEKK